MLHLRYRYLLKPIMKVVSPAVVLQVVEHGLIELRHIAHAERVATDGDVERETMAHGGHVAGIGEQDVVVVLLELEGFVVALSVCGRKQCP